MSFEQYNGEQQLKGYKESLLVVYPNGDLGLTKQACDTLGNPATVSLYYDRESKHIGVSTPRPDGRSFPLRREKLRGVGKISAAAFARYYGIPLEKRRVVYTVTVTELNGQPMIVQSAPVVTLAIARKIIETSYNGHAPRQAVGAH